MGVVDRLCLAGKPARFIVDMRLYLPVGPRFKGFVMNPLCDGPNICMLFAAQLAEVPGRRIRLDRHQQMNLRFSLDGSVVVENIHVLCFPHQLPLDHLAVDERTSSSWDA